MQLTFTFIDLMIFSKEETWKKEANPYTVNPKVYYSIYKTEARNVVPECHPFLQQGQAFAGHERLDVVSYPSPPKHAQNFEARKEE